MLNTGITLTASMRSNLMSLKNIATQMDKTQNILSTGKKVNSAIDNASSYYQARSLTNRATDLNSLLDSMGQGIQTLQAANEGIEAATSYLEQMKSVAEQALALPDNSNTTNAPTPPQTQQRGPQLEDNSAELIAQGYKAIDANMSMEELTTLLTNAQSGDKFVLTSNFILNEPLDLRHLENLTINGGGHTFYGLLKLGNGATVENMNIVSTGEDENFAVFIQGVGTVKNVSIKTTAACAVLINDYGTIENTNIDCLATDSIAVMFSIFGSLDQSSQIKNVNIKGSNLLGGACSIGHVSVDGLYIDTTNENAIGIKSDYSITGIAMGERTYPDEWYSGKENSKNIDTACREYYVGDRNGEFGQREWYRASVGELENLYGNGSNIAVINNTLDVLANDNIAEKMTGSYWASNDDIDLLGELAYCFNVDNGTINDDLKSSPYGKDRAMWEKENYFDPASANKPQAGDIMYLDGSWGTLADYDSSKASQVAGVICNTDENGTVKVIGLKDLTFASEWPYDFDPENPYGNVTKDVVWSSSFSGVNITLSSPIPNDDTVRTVKEVNNAYHQKYGIATASTLTVADATPVVASSEAQPLTSQVQLTDNSAELKAQGYKELSNNMTEEEIMTLLGGLQSGDKIVLTSDFIVDEPLDLSHLENLTINGGGHTIICGGLVYGDGAVIENMKLNIITSEAGGCIFNGSGTIRNVDIDCTYIGYNLPYIVVANENINVENVNINSRSDVVAGVVANGYTEVKNLTLNFEKGVGAGVVGTSGVSIDGMSMNEDAGSYMGMGPYAVCSMGNISGLEDYVYTTTIDGEIANVVDIADVNAAFARVENNAGGSDLYQSHIKQYKQLVGEFNNMLADTSYQGVNLLTGGEMKVTFNETRTHDFLVKGEDIRSDKIGLTTINWENKSDVKAAINEITSAINKLRSVATDLGNKYSIIQTRQDFTESLVDVLETGADDLVLADMNEASAEYLMLQTRQQLAVNSLSLASQSASSVLRLF